MWLIYLTADPHLCTSSSLKLWTCFGLECWKTTKRIGEEFTRYSALLLLHHLFTFKWNTDAEMKCTLHAQCLVKIIGRAYIQGILCIDFDMGGCNESPPLSQGPLLLCSTFTPCPTPLPSLYISLLLNSINFLTQSNSKCYIVKSTLVAVFVLELLLIMLSSMCAGLVTISVPHQKRVRAGGHQRQRTYLRPALYGKLSFCR